MNEPSASVRVISSICDMVSIPMVGLTLTQDEADAIKRYIHARVEASVQGAVHYGFVRRDSDLINS